MAPTYEEALQGIRQIVADTIADMQINHEKIPEPLATKKYSGHFMIRIPPELHSQMAIEAAESGISLNRLVSDRLSRKH